MDSVKFFKTYIKAQIALSCVLAVLYSLGFGLVGLPYGYLIGAVTGLLSWIPFVGSLIGFFVAMMVIAFHFSWPLLLKVCGVYFGLQLLEAVFLAPKILGKSVGLGFLQSLAAVIIGTLLFGPIGAVVAIPVAAFVKFLLESKARKELETFDKK